MVTQLLASDRSRCLHCGKHVTRNFRRTFGDSDNRAHRCNECDTYARLSRGSGAGCDVGIPDPETAPGRHGNQESSVDRGDGPISDGGREFGTDAVRLEGEPLELPRCPMCNWSVAVLVAAGDGYAVGIPCGHRFRVDQFIPDEVRDFEAGHRAYLGPGGDDR